MISLADIILRGQQLNTRGRPLAEGIATAGQAFGTNLAKRFEDEAAQDRARKQREQAAMAAAAEAGLTNIFGSEEERAKIQAELDDIYRDQELARDFLADVERADELRKRLAEGKYVTRWQERFIQDVDEKLGRKKEELPERSFWERLVDYSDYRPPTDPQRERLMERPEGAQWAIDATNYAISQLHNREEELKQKLASQPKLVSEMSDEELAEILGKSKKALKDAEIEFIREQERAKAEAEASKAVLEAIKDAREEERKKFEETQQVAKQYRSDFKEDLQFINALNTAIEILDDPNAKSNTGTTTGTATDSTTGAATQQKVRTLSAKIPNDHTTQVLRALFGSYLDKETRKEFKKILSGGLFDKFVGSIKLLVTGAPLTAETYSDLINSLVEVRKAMYDRLKPQLDAVKTNLDPRFVNVDSFFPLLGYQDYYDVVVPTLDTIKKENPYRISNTPSSQKQKPLISAGGRPVQPGRVEEVPPGTKKKRFGQ